MNRFIGIVVGISLVFGQAGVVTADVNFTPEGKLVQSGVYAGPGLTMDDAAFFPTYLLGYGLGAFRVASSQVAGMTMATSVLAWGAWRTAQYRPQVVKDMIHANLTAQANQPQPGTVWALVQ